MVIMNGDRVTKTPNNSVASPRSRVNGEGMLAVQGMICVEFGLPSRSLPIYVCFLVPMGCFPARLPTCCKELLAACLRMDKNGTIRARRMIGQPSPRLMLISKLQSGLLAISTWMSVSPVKGQCFRCSRHSCRCWTSSIRW